MSRGNPHPSHGFRAGEARTFEASDKGNHTLLLRYGEGWEARQLEKARARRRELIERGRESDEQSGG